MYKYILGLIILAGVIGGGWFWRETYKYTKAPVLNNLRQEVIRKWGDCAGTPDTCMKLDVELEKEGDTWYVIATKSGLGDDSVSAVRYRAPLDNFEGGYGIGWPVVITGKCARGDNTREFTTQPCP